MENREYKKLHAEWYELGSAQMDHSKEIDFLARRIKASGEPVLELGSGTGRILIPLLERGVNICGIDTSTPMMDRCRAICKVKGLKAELYERSMLDFNLPQRFGTIILASGSLSLFVADQDIHAMCKQVIDHLKPAGLFICGFERLPEADHSSDGGQWTGDWLSGPDDSVIAWRRRHKYDPATHVWQQLFIVEKYVKGRLIETEANERTGRFFAVDEAMNFVKSAGFTAIEAIDWQAEQDPAKESGPTTILCRKPPKG